MVLKRIREDVSQNFDLTKRVLGICSTFPTQTQRTRNSMPSTSRSGEIGIPAVDIPPDPTWDPTKITKWDNPLHPPANMAALSSIPHRRKVATSLPGDVAQEEEEDDEAEAECTIFIPHPQRPPSIKAVFYTHLHPTFTQNYQRKDRIACVLHMENITPGTATTIIWCQTLGKEEENGEDEHEAVEIQYNLNDKKGLQPVTMSLWDECLEKPQGWRGRTVDSPYKILRDCGVLARGYFP
ncbi:hypothetical protein EJ08DRAFT_444688 [Tothia fuscella]|uniref:Uncharacterized protein n=1 Tax=Tothia fuscella TaxID=1048955 RepID=A0A9P4TTY0_9PEZI|nr:hypothetical protein EJ08DRAFT_444688 [Tothia fuscella]